MGNISQKIISYLTTFFYFLPLSLSLLLGVAHFFRNSNTPLQISCVILFFLLPFRHQLIAKTIQWSLIALSLEWVWTGYKIASVRIENDENWHRLVLIIGAVALFTFCSSCLIYTKRLKRYYLIP